MPVDYAAAKTVVSKKANRIRLVSLTLRMHEKKKEHQQILFDFAAFSIEMIDDPNFVQPDPANPVAVPQIKQITQTDSQSVNKSVAEVKKDYPTEFNAIYNNLKKVAYGYMVSEGVFPAGTVT